jgi:hypothetical protein
MPGFGPARTVPSPGQTVTSGSWTGPTPAPAPTGGQLAAGVGISRVPRPQTYSKGTTSVKAPGKGMKGYAGGTANVQPFLGGGTPPDTTVPPAFASAPAAAGQPGFLDKLMPYITVGNPASPIFSLGSPVGAAPPSPMNGQAGDFQMHPMPQPVQPTAPAPAQGQPGGSLTAPLALPALGAGGVPEGALINRGFNTNGPAPFPKPGQKPFVPPAGDSAAVDPRIEAAFRASPAALQAAVAGQVAHPNGTTKADGNPTGTAVIAALTGARDTHAHAMSQPHQYTQDEFVDALRGVPLSTIEKLWSMQHYQNPQAQIAPRFLQTQQNITDKLQKEYDDLNHAGTPQATLKAAFDRLNQQKIYHAQAVSALALGPQAITMGGIQSPPGFE